MNIWQSRLIIGGPGTKLPNAILAGVDVKTRPIVIGPCRVTVRLLVLLPPKLFVISCLLQDRLSVEFGTLISLPCSMAA